MDDPLETAEIAAFARTVEARSLSRAALELGVPRATISRRLARLEERLGTRLLRRSTRSLTLTEAGEAFYRHARIVLDAVGDAEASVRRTDETVRGELRVSVPPMMSASFNAMINAFVARHPEVRLSIHCSSQLVDLRRGGFDVAVRASRELEPGLVARTIARTPVVALAAPGYLQRHGTPRALRDLRKHRLLLGFAGDDLPQREWPVAGGGKVHVDGSFFSNEITILRDAAVDGLGIALLPQIMGAPFFASGQLVPVLPGVIGAESKVVVVYAEREYVPPQVRAFVDHIVPWAMKEIPNGGSPSWRQAARANAETKPVKARPRRSRR